MASHVSAREDLHHTHAINRCTQIACKWEYIKYSTSISAGLGASISLQLGVLYACMSTLILQRHFEVGSTSVNLK